MDFRKKGTDKEIYDKYKEQISQGKHSIYLVEKNDFLITKGLYKLIESTQEEKDSFLDEDDGKYWKKIPLDISHEEYMYIKKLHGEIKEHKTRGSGVSILGLVVILIGIIIAITISTVAPYQQETLKLAAIITLLFGFLFIACGTLTEEIKRIYDAIRDLK